MAHGRCFCSGCEADITDAIAAAREQGRREGYAECQRDVVAWLRERARVNMSHVRKVVLSNAGTRIEAGEHVGCAKAKGGNRG